MNRVSPTSLNSVKVLCEDQNTTVIIFSGSAKVRGIAQDGNTKHTRVAQAKERASEETFAVRQRNRCSRALLERGVSGNSRHGGLLIGGLCNA